MDQELEYLCQEIDSHVEAGTLDNGQDLDEFREYVLKWWRATKPNQGENST